eukprot:gnl/TRDRNA2_/TRDRNA2_34580_c0_seq1.p1 gnl/TRDRNA2_/TRDRNA2_34580_c0~~gnl/TRDRNA2_/TRDRNA2_34580_c0_seq1.p1  ORF type:complete len:403 (-),score=54.30 gnl/TRDRNA2_/TRDRNA2_34580_c0_seq1:106-1266(-)
MGCGLISQRGPAIAVHHPLALDPRDRAAGARIVEEDGDPPTLAMPAATSSSAGQQRSQPRAGDRETTPADESSMAANGTAGGADESPPQATGTRIGGQLSRRFLLGERVVSASRLPNYTQDHAFCFECGAFFQLNPARQPTCTRCQSSFVQFLRGTGNAHWITAESSAGVNFSFDDQLERSIEASLEESPTSRRPTQANFLRTLPTLVLSEEEVQSRSQLGAADPKAHCAICREVFCLGDTLKCLPCKHEFHEMCVVPWLSNNNTCPICRLKLPEAKDGEEEDAEEGEVMKFKRAAEPVSVDADESASPVERSTFGTQQDAAVATPGQGACDRDEDVPADRMVSSSPSLTAEQEQSTRQRPMVVADVVDEDHGGEAVAAVSRSEAE